MTEIVEYSAVESAIATLENKYKNVVYAVTTVQGMKDAIAARYEIKNQRVGLEKERKRIKETALRRCQVIDSEARRITSALESLENPIDEQIKGEERRKEEEKWAALRAEADRKQAEEEAAREAERQRIATAQVEILRQQQELEQQRAAQAEIERKARLAIEAAEREARLKIEEAERVSRLAREEADRKARAEQDEARRKLIEEQRAVEEAAKKLREYQEEKERAQRLAEDEKQREERQAAENSRLLAESFKRQADKVAEEKRRIEATVAADKLEARQLLERFVQRFGNKPEFTGIVFEITKYLKGNNK